MSPNRNVFSWEVNYREQVASPSLFIPNTKYLLFAFVFLIFVFKQNFHPPKAFN